MDRLHGWLGAAVLLLLLVVFDQHHALKQLAVQLEEETKIELNSYRTSRDEMQRSADCSIAFGELRDQEQKLENVLQQCETGYTDMKARFLETTDMLESVARCSFFNARPDGCIGKEGERELKTFLKDNRTGNF